MAYCVREVSMNVPEPLISIRLMRLLKFHGYAVQPTLRVANFDYLLQLHQDIFH